MLKKLPNAQPIFNKFSSTVSLYKKYTKNSWNQVGFTLIELLVVVMVIAALSGIVVSLVNSGGFREKAKDAQKVADLKQLQTALELYFADNRAYPISSSWLEVSGGDIMSNALKPTYISKIPVANGVTTGNGTPCDAQEKQRYNYITNAAGTSYILTAVMALPSSAAEQACGNLQNWGTVGTCGGDKTNCYGVQNP